MVASAAGEILWADPRAITLIGARIGRTLDDLCVAGTAGNGALLAERGVNEVVRGWELPVTAAGRPATVSFCGTPWNGHVLLVGQLLSDEYQQASGVRGAPPQTMRRAPRVFSPGVRTVYS